MSVPDVAVIVVAAGSGARLGAGVPKALAALGGGTILEQALRGVLAASSPVQLIVVAPPELLGQAAGIAYRLDPAAQVVAGAATRQGSVAAGLAVVAVGVRTVLVHDAARALTPGALFDRVLAEVLRTGAGVVPGLPVTDTIKRVDASGAVIETVDRSELAGVQTPQGFPREQLERAYAAATAEHTDDAALYAASGMSVSTVPGEPLAFKITTPADLHRAEGLLVPMNAQGGTRTGVGVDAHAFDESRPLWLGGLYWPDEPGLAGHSDGDAISHAICDALLSAAGLGDIGSRFGTDDPRFADAHGEVFLTETLALVTGAGFSVGNVSVQVVAAHPRIGARRSELEQHLGALLGAPVSVAGTTSDGLGFTGRGEGLSVICTALLNRDR